MNRILLVLLSIAAIACAKSSEAPETKRSTAPKMEAVGPVALDPRAAKPMLDKARQAAAQAAAKDAETANALAEIQ
ncbi:MAG: hypothetical protein CO113_00105 [Elusimicrobia bacterium CG_4_9_14_3_um_filter_62_55]|nr:MAG: hypothetical protein COR54_18335 [Elusimicrobia bacterium CG22_combo_CG10-13_8_21_14_all_63_91]PJA16383.1 MAG: hypothetical protein COX66_07640 [Elusimicrobia bacterium CG_4_10_14_0_2_um_filter_63_34]PJB27107.1 MAG: hypothetical protein CO113_00105 [Elusimicrobia bacterium CG_4_9_14_3_um_filter_62_55]